MFGIIQFKMNFGGQDYQDYFQNIQASISLNQFQNQADFLNIDQKEQNKKQLERTSAKVEETPKKIGLTNEKKLTGNQRKPKNTSIFTLTKFEQVASQNLEGGLISRKQYDEELKLEAKKNFQYYQYLSVAQFKVIQLDHPEVIAQSIDYLYSLAAHQQTAKKSLTKESITRHFSQLFKRGAKDIYKDSTGLLETHLLKIIQELNISRPSDKPELKIEIQVMSYFLKISWQFNCYIPKQMSSSNWNVSMCRIAKFLKISKHQLFILKTAFMKNHHNLIFLNGNKFQIKQLLTTYFLLALKQKYMQFVPSLICKYPLEDTVQQFRASKLEARKQKIRRDQEGLTLSSLYRDPKAEKGYQWKRKQSMQKMKQVTKIFQEIIGESEFDGSDRHPKLIYLRKKYKLRSNTIHDQFRKFVAKRKKELEIIKNNLNSYKNATITRQLIKNPQYSYKDVYLKTYNLTAIRIEEDYFNDNLYSILLKEVQYQQFRYLGNVFKNINNRIRNDISVIFLDSVILKEEEGREGENEENVSPSVSVAVTLKGALLCKACIRPVSQIELLKQYLKMFEEIKPSIILFFDDQFPLPMELEKREELFYLRKIHTIFILPRISLLPNPCKGIVDCLKSALSQYLSRGEELQEAIRGAIHDLDEKQVKEIVNREWEKVEKFVSTLRDGQREEQPNRMNAKDEGQNMVEEFDEFEIPNEFEGVKRHEFEVPKSNSFNPFQKIYLDPEKINEQEISKEFLIPPQSREEFQSQNVSNEVVSLPQTIMENLQSKSVDDLRASLAHLLTRNKKNPFSYNGNFTIRLSEKLSPQVFINKFNQRL